MESPATSVTFGATVVKVEERFHKQWRSGFGSNTVFENISLGWYVTLAGSHEALFINEVKPNIEVGDKAVIRIAFYAR